MSKRSFLLILLVTFSFVGFAQLPKDSIQAIGKVEETSKVTVGGYIDTYYGYDFSKPVSKDRPYFVSSNRHNEFSVNLAFVDLKFTSRRARAAFRPAIGSYMGANYTAEPAIFRNLYEGNVGIKLFANKNIWLDAGVLGSPYTNESAISKDQLLYTRSFAPEYVPYYLSGVKVSIPLGKKLNAYLYLLNGWQNIAETNDQKSIGTQIEYKVTERLLLNWNTYLGDERSETNPNNRMRYFTDIYFIYNPNGKFSATSCFYIGAQNRIDSLGIEMEQAFWQNLNLIARYKFTSLFSISGRIELFNDPGSIQITPITMVNGFRSYSSSLCLNYALTDQILLRMEGRSFFSDKEVYKNREGDPAYMIQLLIVSMAVSF